MITVKICSCGKQYRADAWAALVFKGYQEDEPEDLALRNCTRCGSTLALHRAEDRACTGIAQTIAGIRLAFSSARMSLAFVRLERADAAAEDRCVNERREKTHLKDADEQRRAARVLRGDLRRLEQLVRSMWRARELADPSAKIGRTLVAIDGGVDVRAKTEPPSAESAPSR